MFTPLNKLIGNLPRHAKVSEALLALSVRKAFGDILKKSDLPEEIIGAVSGVTFKNGSLSVKVQGLARAELSMRAGGLIKDINKELGRRAVWKIKFRSY